MARESGGGSGVWESGSPGQICSRFIQRLRRQEPCRAAKCPKNIAKRLLLWWKGCVWRNREQGLESKEGTRKRGKGTVGKASMRICHLTKASHHRRSLIHPVMRRPNTRQLAPSSLLLPWTAASTQTTASGTRRVIFLSPPASAQLWLSQRVVVVGSGY